MVLAHMGKDLIHEGICALFSMVHPHMAFLRHLIAWTEAWTVDSLNNDDERASPPLWIPLSQLM